MIQAVQRLRANATLARKIGRAGRRLALSQLTMERALGYLRALFASYSSIQRERVDIGDSASALNAAGYRQVDSVAAAAAATRSCKCHPQRVEQNYPAACDTTEPAGMLGGGGGGEGRRLHRERARGGAKGSGRGSGRLHRPDPMEESVGSKHCCKDWDCPMDVCTQSIASGTATSRRSS